MGRIPKACHIEISQVNTNAIYSSRALFSSLIVFLFITRIVATVAQRAEYMLLVSCEVLAYQLSVLACVGQV